MTTGQREQESAGDVPEAEAAETAEEAPETALSEETIREAQQLIERMRFSWDHVKRLLYLLKLCRYFDERMETLYRQGKLPGAIYSGRGQEGTHVGVAYPLQPQDSLFPTHRDLSAQLTKGLDLKRVMAQFWGRIDGYTRGRDGNSHVGDWKGNHTFTVISHLPIAYPVAAGAALAYKLRKEPRVALAICGDGATSNGRWHESLNVSAIHQLPVVWVVNNNQFAYSTPNPLEFAVPTIAERAASYGMRGVRVDGSNVLEVVARRARGDRARPRGQRTHADRERLAPVERPRRPRPGQVRPQGAARGVHDRTRTRWRRFEEVCKAMHVIDDKGLAALRRAAWRRRSTRRTSTPRPRRSPNAGDVERGLWAGDGYWEGEAPRGGGTG